VDRRAQVRRDDEISSGRPEAPGDIAELQPFFALLDEVDRARELEARLRQAELPAVASRCWSGS
jgi:hypothetical protein